MACDCLEEAVDDKTIDLQTITNQIKLGQSCHNPLFPEQFLETVLRAREFMITRHGRCGPFLLTVGGDVARHLEKPYFRKIFPERTLRQRLLEVEGITRIEVVSDREAGFSLTLERN